MTADLTPRCGHGHLTRDEVRRGVHRPTCTRVATQHLRRPGERYENWFCDEHASSDPTTALPAPHDPVVPAARPGRAAKSRR